MKKNQIYYLIFILLLVSSLGMWWLSKSDSFFKDSSYTQTYFILILAVVLILNLLSIKQYKFLYLNFSFAIILVSFLAMYESTGAEESLPVSNNKGNKHKLLNTYAKELVSDTSFNISNEHVITENRGKYILLDFWSIYCSPCRKTMPVFNQFYLKNKSSKIMILGVTNIAANNRQEELEKNIRFLNDYNISYPILISDQAINAINYKISGLPVVVLINPEGKIIDYGEGEKESHRVLEKLEAIIYQTSYKI